MDAGMCRPEDRDVTDGKDGDKPSDESMEMKSFSESPRSRLEEVDRGGGGSDGETCRRGWRQRTTSADPAPSS